MSIYQDDDGFMWFGTYDGLNRYDGYEFKIFRNIIGDTTSLSNNTVFAIEGDHHHRLWIGGQKGVSILNVASATFKPVYYKPVARDIILPVTTNIHRIRLISNGQILIGSQDAGLIAFDGESNTGKQVVLEEGAVQRYDVTDIEQGADSSFVWIFIQNKGLFRFETATQQLVPVNNAIRQSASLHYMEGKGLWLGNSNGLFLYDTDKNEFSGNYLPVASPVINISADRDKNIWIATDGGGIFVLGAGETVARHATERFGTTLVKSNSVWRIQEDREGRKWIGTLRGGISVIEPREKSFRHITYSGNDEMLAENFILSFCEDKNRNIWIGTDGAGLRFWDRSANTYKEYKHNRNDPSSLSSNFVTNILNDSYDQVWVSTWFRGINRFNPSTGGFEHFNCINTATGTVERNTWLLHEDAEKELWASATNTGSLYRFNRKLQQFELFDATITDLQALAETGNGEFWGGDYTSLVKIDRQHKNHTRYPIGYAVRCIFEDKDQQLWIGTQEGGLLLFDRNTGTYTRYTEADGLPGNTVLRILEDSTGSLWMSTYNGISKLSPDRRSFRNFSISDGLQSNQFSFNAGTALRSGEFLFGGINGFNIFKPEHIGNERDEIPVLLNGLTVGNTPVRGNNLYVQGLHNNHISQIKLPYDKAVVSIDFLALNYAGADKINYAYLLEGWDKDWNYVQKSRRANYSKLNEGTYRFKVKVTGTDGKWNTETQLLQITVLPPWYRTWWAYLSGFLIVAGSIFLYNRYTRRQERLRYEVKLVNLERKKDKELAEKQFSIFTNVSHEFRTHLALIISPLKKLVSTGDNSPDKELSTAFQNSRRLLSLVDQLLLFKKADAGEDLLKVSPVNLADLCREVYSCFETLSISKALDFRFENNTADPHIYGDYEKIEIILFNIVSNAFKFTDGGSIIIRLDENENDMLLSVEDSGCGIAATDIERIFEKFQQAESTDKKKGFGFGVGLYLVQNFVGRHGAGIRCVSEVGKGTVMEVRFLKGKSHFAGNVIWQDREKKANLLEELAVFENAPVATPVPGEKPREARSASELVSDKKSILIVDDNGEMRDYLSGLFSGEHLVYTAADGAEGLSAALAYLPDLIISDVNMDGMDGVELCLKIKQSPQLSHIPVILLTAVDAAEIKLKGVASGADDYITKPFDDDLLIAKVQSTLKNRLQLRKYFLDSVTLRHNTLKVPAEYQDFLEKCIRIVEENIDNEEFTIKSFATQMGMSHSALYNKVKAISGQSLNAFIRSIRLRRAAVFMLTGNVNISQAAFQVGIGDIRYFREQFVKLFGMTPSEYIKKYRHNFNTELNIIKIKA